MRLDFFLHIPSNWVKIGWHTENQLPEVGKKQCMEKKKKKRETEPKSVLTIVNSTQTAWTKMGRMNKAYLSGYKTYYGGIVFHNAGTLTLHQQSHNPSPGPVPFSLFLALFLKYN